MAGSLWQVAGRLLARSLDLVAILVLARLLVPEDFGIFALAGSLVAVLEASSALSAELALVRLSRITKAHLDTAFTMNLLRGICITLAAIAMAPLFAHFYGDDRLFAVIVLIALGSLFRSLQSPAIAILLKDLKFVQSMVIDSGGRMTAFVVSIAGAIAGLGYWALVLGFVVAPITSVVASYLYAPYRPSLSLRRLHDFLGFAGWMTVAQLVSSIAWQFDRLLLGRVAPVGDLGRYQVSSNIAIVPEQSIVRAVVSPLLAGFVLVRDDLPRLREAICQAELAVFKVGGFILVMMALYAAPGVRLLFTEEWLPMIPLVQGLALAYLPALQRISFRSLAMALDRAKDFAVTTLVTSVLRVGSIVAGFLLGGVPGLIAGIAAANLCGAVIFMVMTRRMIDLPVRHQLAALWRPALACFPTIAFALVSVTFMAPLDGLELGLAVLASVAIASGLYGGMLMAIWYVDYCPRGVEGQLVRIVRRFLLPALPHRIARS